MKSSRITTRYPDRVIDAADEPVRGFTLVRIVLIVTVGVLLSGCSVNCQNDEKAHRQHKSSPEVEVDVLS
jgi:hypothetical protein